MKKTKENKLETEMLRSIKKLKSQFLEEIENVVEEYYSFSQNPSFEMKKIGPIDVISILELAKLRFFCRSQVHISRKIQLQTKRGEVDSAREKLNILEDELNDIQRRGL